MSTDRPRPFLKWPGGKRLLAADIARHFPDRFCRYFEPFVGGGAVFFHARPRRSTLADANPELVNVYKHVRDRVDEVIRDLSRLTIGRDEYYGMRQRDCLSPLQSAVRFLYLNRTAFNGIYRVNRQGRFNVPFGCKPGTVLCDRALLRNASAALRSASVRCCDFAEIFSLARSGDLIYADPPYTVMHDNNGFRRYNESIFSWRDQERLALAARNAAARGVAVLVSNADHGDIRAMYKGFRQVVLTRPSCIAGSVAARKSISELLLVA